MLRSKTRGERCPFHSRLDFRRVERRSFATELPSFSSVALCAARRFRSFEIAIASLRYGVTEYIISVSRFITIVPRITDEWFPLPLLRGYPEEINSPREKLPRRARNCSDRMKFASVCSVRERARFSTLGSLLEAGSGR